MAWNKENSVFYSRSTEHAAHFGLITILVLYQALFDGPSHKSNYTPSTTTEHFSFSTSAPTMACIEIETNLSGFFLFLSFFFHCTCECVRDVNVVYDNAVAATVEDNDDDDDQRIDANKRE